MYKTVRQGENSLQYTILPQTEEVLNNSGMKGKGRDYSPSIHVRRSKKGADVKGILFAICFLLAMLAAMVGTVCLLNYYTMSRPTVTAAAERAASFVASVVGVSSHRDEGSKSRKKELRMPEALATPRVDSETATNAEIATATATASAPSTAPTAPATPSPDRRTKPAWLMPALQFWKSSSVAPTVSQPTPIVEDQDELNIPNGPFSRQRIASHDRLADVIIRPAVTVEPTAADVTVPTRQVPTTLVHDTESSTPRSNKVTWEPSRATAPADVLITTKWGVVLPQPVGTEDHGPREESEERDDKTYPLGKVLKDMKESILNDEEEFKEEVLSMPPLKKENVGKTGAGWMEVGDDVTVTKASSPKLRNMWPFEPSMSLFQWPEYSQEDSMVVPLLVGTATLLTVALVLTAVVVRRRRDQAKGASHIGKLTADLQADDNTNLLMAESQEEE